MEAEMEDHLGYEKSERSDTDDYRNGYKSKTVKSSIGQVELAVPQDRKSTFEPQVVKKGQKDISDIDHKIISMYAKGMTTRQISDTIEDIYGLMFLRALFPMSQTRYLRRLKNGKTGCLMMFIRSFTTMPFTILSEIIE